MEKYLNVKERKCARSKELDIGSPIETSSEKYEQEAEQIFQSEMKWLDEKYKESIKNEMKGIQSESVELNDAKPKIWTDNKSEKDVTERNVERCE